MLLITHVPPEYRQPVPVGLDRLCTGTVLRDIDIKEVQRHGEEQFFIQRSFHLILTSGNTASARLSLSFIIWNASMTWW